MPSLASSAAVALTTFQPWLPARPSSFSVVLILSFFIHQFDLILSCSVLLALSASSQNLFVLALLSSS